MLNHYSRVVTGLNLIIIGQYLYCHIVIQDFESVIFDQLLNYFIENNILSIEQFGFRPGHSTELAAVKLVQHLISEMDNNNTPVNIYIDLSKAFDTLNYFILLSKLKYYDGVNVL